DRNRVALLEFLFPFTILDFDQNASVDYGRIRSLLESKGRPIGPMDLLLYMRWVSRRPTRLDAFLANSGGTRGQVLQ
ncbi:MAG: type II toxin-antitoxin system VapC family toxin, partial [Phycisphaerae bacterium]|nr:type II toxin-antitoxin system VapC family toxin [Phycisphaerae bacterium]